MNTKAPARPAARQSASQTLTLDMDLPPAPIKPTRKATVPKAPAVVAAPRAGAKPASAKTASVPAKPVSPKGAAVQAKPSPAKTAAGTFSPADGPPKAAIVKQPASKTPTLVEKTETPTPLAAKPKVAEKAKTAVPAPPAARVERELALEGGRLWRMSGRHAVAYVQNASLACALLAVETKHLARHAMAVYYDKKGRAIGWQVRFDAQQWDEVIRRLG